MERGERDELKESILEYIEDAVNIIHLLIEELTATEEDAHIIRSIGIIGKILNAALENLKRTG